MLHSTTCTNPLSPNTKATLEKHGLTGANKVLPSLPSKKQKRDIGCITGKI